MNPYQDYLKEIKSMNRDKERDQNKSQNNLRTLKDLRY